MKIFTKLGLASISLMFFTNPAQAYNIGPYDLVFEYSSGANIGSSGTGTWSLNQEELKSVLCIDYGGNFDCGTGQELEPITLNGLQYLESFSVTFTDLSSTPNTVSFTKSDLSGWSLSIDRIGNFLGDPSFYGPSLNIMYTESPESWLATVNFSNGETVYEVSTNTPYPIPEPITLLGVGTAIGFGVRFKTQKKG